MDLRGMHQVFSLGPAHLPGATVYQDIHEVRPGKTIIFSQGRIIENTFWHLQAKRHEETYEETVDHVSHLLSESLHLQYHDDVAQCCLLSGGLDSSVVTALANRENMNQGTPLTTYSFDFTDSAKYFSANDFQPSLDRPYVIAMAEHFHTNHTFLECNSKAQASLWDNRFSHTTVLVWQIFPRLYSISVSRLPCTPRLPLPENVQTRFLRLSMVPQGAYVFCQHLPMDDGSSSETASPAR